MAVIENYKFVGRKTKTAYLGELKLQVGRKYIFVRYERTEQTAKLNPVRYKEKLITFYTHHAVFEDEHGIRRSYRYWELEKLLKGEQYEQSCIGRKINKRS